MISNGKAKGWTPLDLGKYYLYEYCFVKLSNYHITKLL